MKYRAIKLLIVVIFASFHVCNASTVFLRLTQNYHTVVDDKTKCLVNYIFTFFKYKDLSIYRHVNDSEYLWDKTVYGLMQGHDSRLLNLEISLCREDQCREKKHVYKQYLIFARSVSQLSYVLNKCTCSIVNAASRILIIAVGGEDVGGMVDVLREYQLHFAFLVATLEDDTLTSHFIPPRYCKGIVERMTSTYQCLAVNNSLPDEMTVCKQRQLSVDVRASPPFVLTLGNYTRYLYPQLHPIQGYEVHLLRLMFEDSFDITFYGSTLHKTLGSYDEKNRTGYGLLKELAEFEIDLFFGAVNNHNISTIVEASHPILCATLIAIVKTRNQPRFFVMFSMFTLESWAFIVALFAIHCILPQLLNYFSRHPIQFRSPIFKFFTIFIGQDINVNERRRSLRLVFLSWICFSFMVRSGYEAFTTMLFIDKSSIKQIDTLGELCHRNYTIFITEVNHWSFRNGLRLEDCVLKNFVIVNSPLKTILDHDSDTVAAFMYMESFAYQIILRFKYDYDKFHVIKEPIGLEALSYYTRRGDVLLRVLKERGLRALESGLLVHYDKWMRVHHRKRLSDMPASSMKLSIDKLQTVFYLYFCCILLAFVCFFVEILIHKFGKAKLKKYSSRSGVQNLSSIERP